MRLPRLFISCLLCLLCGCASLVGSATSRMADNISRAMLDQNDPATVRAGAPAYLLMIDGLIAGEPDNAELLIAGAKLYGSYSGAFVEDEPRAQRLAARSLDYARRALCLENLALCESGRGRLDAFATNLARTGKSEVDALYALAVSWAGWIQVNASDWNAIADLAKVTALFERCIELDEAYEAGGSHLYLGVIKSLRPAILGGEPDAARRHFERAIELSGGHNLMAKVLMAKHYARTVFDQELHDRLLNEVLSAPTEYPGYTLINTLAVEEARQLLATSSEFF